MKMKWKMAMLVALALALVANAALAMPIASEEGTIALTGIKEDGGKTVKTNLQSFHLLGLDDAGNYLIYGNQTFYSIAPENMLGVLAQLDPEAVAALPRLSDFAPLARGDKGDAVAQFQQALIAAGYLKGAADGDFGAGTERTVLALQAELGMEETGAADERLQLLALSMSQPEVLISETSSAASLFDAIADRTDVDLQAILASGLSLTYDDITGVGFISDGQTLTYDASGDSDIDLYQVSLKFGLAVQDQEDGAVDITPAVQVSCLCVRRPVLTDLIVKSGSLRGSADIADLSVSLDGSYTLESGTAVLSEQMVNALANAREAGELKVRVNGRYNSFDIQASEPALASLAKIGEVAQSLNQ